MVFTRTPRIQVWELNGPHLWGWACEKGCFMAFRIYLVHLCTCSLENIHVGGNFLSRGIEKGMAYAKFKAHRFAFLNVTTIGPDNVVKAGSECGLACVNSLSCLSFNLAVFHGMNGKLLCQLLPTDIYNNSDKFSISEQFHHYSISVRANHSWQFYQKSQFKGWMTTHGL